MATDMQLLFYSIHGILWWQRRLLFWPLVHTALIYLQSITDCRTIIAVSLKNQLPLLIMLKCLPSSIWVYTACSLFSLNKMKKNPLCNMRQLMLSQVGMGHFPVVYGCDVPPFPLACNSCSLFMNVVVIC